MLQRVKLYSDMHCKPVPAGLALRSAAIAENQLFILDWRANSEVRYSMLSIIIEALKSTNWGKLITIRICTMLMKGCWTLQRISPHASASGTRRSRHPYGNLVTSRFTILGNPFRVGVYRRRTQSTLCPDRLSLLGPRHCRWRYSCHTRYLS